MSDEDRSKNIHEEKKLIEKPITLQKPVDRRNRLNDFDVFAPSRHDFNL